MTGPRPDFLPRLAGILWILLVALAGMALSEPRGVVPATAPPDEFSAERALQYVREVARAPHPVGSPEHERVRDTLVHELSALGLEPAVQTTAAFLGSYGTGATVQNIAARKRGTLPGPALLLAAHYDSVPAGPGAGDDGAGVATLLETARALSAGPSLRNDVIFLFTDGEELGLLGASAFVAEHPWRKDVGVALNFDNRGTRGAVLMYETSPGNLPLLRGLAAAVPSPRASSLSAAVSRLLPNSSDFFVFQKAKMPGMNFAFIGGPEQYHTMQDTPEKLDLRTLQQSGNYALPLARRLANVDLARFAESDAPDAVFFNPAGGWEIVYPQSWARPLGILVLVLFLGVAGAGFARRAVQGNRVLLALVFCAVSLLAAWRIGDWLVIYLPRLQGGGGPTGPYFFHPLYAAVLYALAAGLTCAVWELGGLRWQEIALAGAGVWAVAGVVVAFRMPAASYLFVWPLVPVLVALGILILWRGEPTERARVAQTALAWLGVVPAVLLLGPLLPLLHLALGMSMIGAPAQAAAVALTTWLVAPVLAPRSPGASGHDARIPLMLLATGSVLFIVGLATVRYDDRHPRPEWMAYVKDADRASAQWFSQAAPNPGVTGIHVDPWRAQFLTANPESTYLPFALPWHTDPICWAHAAPAVELDPPAAELLNETASEETRVLRIALRSPRRAARLSIDVQAQKIVELRVNGKIVGERRFSPATLSSRVTRGGAYHPREQRQGWNLLYAGPPEGGIELLVVLPKDSPFEITLADISDGLPTIPEFTVSPRPPSVTQQQLADMTVVIKSFAF